MGFFVYISIFLLISTSKSATKANTDAGHYLVVAPNNLHPERDYSIVVAVYNTTEPCELMVGISGLSQNITKNVELPPHDQVKLVTLNIPKLKREDYNFTVEGIAGLIFKNSTPLTYDDNMVNVIIETDKNIYKPGDKIRFRVIFLDENLRPVQPDNSTVISIENDKQYRIKEIRDIKTVSGVFTGEYEISEYTMDGFWSMLVSSGRQGYPERQVFQVKKYVLPKYTINVEATPKVAVQDGDMQILVRANYTYGKPVNGKVHLDLRLNSFGYYYYNNVLKQDSEKRPAITRTTRMINGKAKFDVNVREYENQLPRKNYQSYLDVVTTVEEDFTGVKLNATTGAELYPYRYEAHCIEFNTCFNFKSDQPQIVKYRLTYIDGTALNDTKTNVRFSYTEAFDVKYEYREKVMNLTLPKINPTPFIFEGRMNKSGIVSFKRILPKLESYEHLRRYYNLTFEYKDENRSLQKIYPQYEPEKIEDPQEHEEPKTYFHITPNYPKNKYSFKLGEDASFLLNSSTPLNYFIYYIMGRTNILHAEKIVLPVSNHTYTLKLKTNFAMSPTPNLYICYINETTYLHCSTKSFSIEMNLLNSINITAPVEVKPGSDVALTIQTHPKSFVGLTAIDRSLLLLDNEFGHYNKLSPNNLIWSMASNKGLVTLSNANPFWPEELHFYPSYNKYRKGVVTALSAMPQASTYSDEPSGGAQKSSPDVVVRKDFAETWIFDNIESTESEIFNWTKKIPDTITSWIIKGFSIHPEKGIGVTNEETEIRTFQPFFISVRLPYFVVRGELIRVPALIFNYLNKKLFVEVTLDNSENEYEFIDTANEIIEDKERSLQITVPANEAEGVEFLIRPKVIGNIKLKLKAVSALAGDAIEKLLKVVPEGVTQFVNRAVFLQLKGEQSEEHRGSFALEYPQNFVADSQRVEISAIGDLLGPVLNNLENLIRLPSGCGEQTMSKMMPNYLVLVYLKTINKLTPDLENRIKRNLEKGYQNLLNYRHDDGSFSSFGPQRYYIDHTQRVTNGSTWLTAYILRSLSQISRYIDIDKDILERGYNYLLSKQNATGAFMDGGESFYYNQRSQLLLTASTLLTLIELDKQTEAPFENALNYITKHFEESDGLLPKAIVVYALSQANKNSTAAYLNKLKELATHKDDRTWWSDNKCEKHNMCHSHWYHYIDSAAVETTSYMVLTLLDIEAPENLIPTIKWLIEQRNSYGGFGSSQDTVVGLQALIKFVEKSGYEPATMEIEVYANDEKKTADKIKLSNINGLLLNILEFGKGTKSIDYIAKGKGAALVQISYQYNVVDSEQIESFQINHTLKQDVPANVLGMDVCVAFIEEDMPNSNMAVLEVTMPSGYTVDDENFAEIEEVDHVRQIEKKNSDSMIVIYFDSLPKSETVCVPIRGVKNFDVSKQKPAPIVLYDYYDPNKRVTKYFSILTKS